MNTDTTDTSSSDLENRIAARRAELIAMLAELRADTRTGSAEARDKLKAKLSELAHIIKEGIVDSWANISDMAARRLDRWLVEAANQFGRVKSGPS